MEEPIHDSIARTTETSESEGRLKSSLLHSAKKKRLKSIIGKYRDGEGGPGVLSYKGEGTPPWLKSKKKKKVSFSGASASLKALRKESVKKTIYSFKAGKLTKLRKPKRMKKVKSIKRPKKSKLF